MALDQHEKKSPCQGLPFLPWGRPAILIIVFLLCAGIGISNPVHALDAYNQTLINSMMNRGSQCFNDKDYSCAWAAFEEAHAADPGNPEVLFVHGYYLSLAGNNTGAFEKMDAALALNPQNAGMWYYKGKVLAKLGRFAESESCYNRAEEVNPSFRVEETERFPLNILIGNAAVIIVAVGFILLGTFIYFRERRR